MQRVVVVMVVILESVVKVVAATDAVVSQLTAALNKSSLFLLTLPSATILVSVFK